MPFSREAVVWKRTITDTTIVRYDVRALFGFGSQEMRACDLLRHGNVQIMDVLFAFRHFVCLGLA